VCARRDVGGGNRGRRSRARCGADLPPRARTSSLLPSPQNKRDSLRNDRGNRLISREPPFRPTSARAQMKCKGHVVMRRSSAVPKVRGARGGTRLADDFDASANHARRAKTRERRRTDELPFVFARCARRTVRPLSFDDCDRRTRRCSIGDRCHVLRLSAAVLDHWLAHPRPTSHRIACLASTQATPVLETCRSANGKCRKDHRCGRFPVFMPGAMTSYRRSG